METELNKSKDLALRSQSPRRLNARTYSIGRLSHVVLRPEVDLVDESFDSSPQSEDPRRRFYRRELAGLLLCQCD
jgi:hypothetical protein